MNEDERLPAGDNVSPFERIRRTNAAGAEYWSSRDFAQVLGYSDYRNFEQVVRKAKTACFNSGQRIEDHFVDIAEMIEIGKGGQRPVATVCMSRYACYLIVQNADPSKEIVAFGQTYFKTIDELGGTSPENLPPAENIESLDAGKGKRPRALTQAPNESRTEGNSNNGPVERNAPTRWIRVERWILVLTFICTAVANIYSVRLARKTLDQVENELRPWIVIPQVDSYFKADRMETKFRILNIGKIPAFYTVENELYCVRQADEQLEPKLTESLLAIMPGQTIWIGGYGVKGEAYDRVRKKSLTGNFVQSIRVKYGHRKSNVGDCWTYLKVRFDCNDLPNDLQGTNTGMWDIIETDFE